MHTVMGSTGRRKIHLVNGVLRAITTMGLGSIIQVLGSF